MEGISEISYRGRDKLMKSKTAVSDTSLSLSDVEIARDDCKE
jgi:hypothetical protein